MSADERDDALREEAFVRELLGLLDDDQPAAPPQLPDRAIRKVQAELTSRDLIDLTTFVFLMRFCAPLLDLLAAFFGHDPMAQTRTQAQPRAQGQVRSDPERNEASRNGSQVESERRSDPGDRRDE